MTDEELLVRIEDVIAFFNSKPTANGRYVALCITLDIKKELIKRKEEKKVVEYEFDIDGRAELYNSRSSIWTMELENTSHFNIVAEFQKRHPSGRLYCYRVIEKSWIKEK